MGSNNNNDDSGGGGFFDFLFGAILKPLRDIIKGAIQLVKFLIILVTKIPEILEFVFTIFQPSKLLNDIVIGIVMGIQLLFRNLLDKLNLSSYFSGKGKISKNCKGKHCYKLTFLNSFVLLLCPPGAIFMKGGIRLWFEILICSMLTIYAYYFPGLLFALLIIQR